MKNFRQNGFLVSKREGRRIRSRSIDPGYGQPWKGIGDLDVAFFVLLASFLEWIPSCLIWFFFPSWCQGENGQRLPKPNSHVHGTKCNWSALCLGSSLLERANRGEEAWWGQIISTLMIKLDYFSPIQIYSVIWWFVVLGLNALTALHPCEEGTDNKSWKTNCKKIYISFSLGLRKSQEQIYSWGWVLLSHAYLLTRLVVATARLET